MSEQRKRDPLSNQAAGDLFQNKQQLTEILESIRDGFMALDYDWRFIFVNHKAAQTANMDPADLLGKSIWETWPQLRGTPLEASYRKAMIERQPDQVEVRGLLTGRWYDVRSYPSSGGISVFYVDVTERRLAELALKRNEHQLRTVLENLPVGVRFFDSSGNVVYRNPAAGKIWGGGEAAGENRGPRYRGWRLETGQLIAAEEWAGARAIARGETILNDLIGIEVSDGSHKFLRHSAIPILDDDGKTLGAITVSEDITELKRAEEKLRQLNEELEHRIRARTMQLATAKDRIETLAELSHVLAEVETDRQKVLNTVASQVAELVGDTCTIALLTEDNQYLQAVAYYHPNPRAMVLLREMTQIKRRADEGALGEVVQKGQAVVIANIPQEVYRSTAMPEYLPYLDEFGIHDILVVPLRARGQTIGTLAVSRDEPGRTYTRTDQTFLQGLADRAALAIENAQLFADLEEQLIARKRIEEENLELQRLLLDSAENERSRIACELHDGPMQDLYGLIYQMNEPERLSTADITSIRDELSQINATLRSISIDLRPPSLFQLGIKSSIKEHLNRIQQAKPDLIINFDLTAGERGVPEIVRLALYRIYQVAITNALRHAEASEVSVRFTQNEDVLIMEVEDNGVGFDVPKRWIDFARQGHLGIVGAMERAEAIGGKLEVQSSAGQGTCFRVVVPLRN